MDPAALQVVSEQGALPAMLFRCDFPPSRGTMPLLSIRTGELKGLPPNRILTCAIYWSPDANFTTAYSIDFQLMAHSQTFVFMGRKQMNLQGQVFLRLDLPRTEGGQVMHEFSSIDVLSIEQQYLTKSYPPNLNYGGMVPATARAMLNVAE